MASRARSVITPPPLPARVWWHVVVPFALVVCAGLVAYQGTWRNEFLFDDLPAIDENLALQAGDWWGAAFAERHHPLANRPLSCLTIAIDFAVFGTGPFGPHLTNLLLHLGNAMLLYATLRRALCAPNLAGRFDPVRARWLATAVATIWVVHPLGVDAVAYATQRSTLLISGLLLVAMHATLCAHGSVAAKRWRALAVAAMALGMASKEDMVVGPLLLVLFERAFLLPSWVALRSRLPFYGALAVTWLVLLFCVAKGPHNPTVGYATAAPITAFEWLMTQAGVVLHYLRLVAWPMPLRGAYDWGPVRDFGAAVLPGLAVLFLLGVVAWSWRRWPWWGWLGALFFLLLAPTSTILPIDTEIVAERRMYLPMLVVLVPVAMGCARFLARTSAKAWLGFAATAALVGTLAWICRDRVSVYAGEQVFWADAYAKMQPERRTFLAAQIISNQGAMLWNQGRHEEAHELFERSMACERPTAVERMHYAISLHYRGRQDEANDMLRQLAIQDPDNGEVMGSLGTCLVATYYGRGGGRNDPLLFEAEAALRRSLELKPNKAAFWNSLAYVLRSRGLLSEAAEAYGRTTALSTEHIEPFLYRAEVLEQLGRQQEIGPMFEGLMAARPGDAPLRVRLAEIELRRRDPAAAGRLLQEALRIEPGNIPAAQLLRRLQENSGR